MSLNTCCFPLIRSPLSQVLHLFTQPRSCFKFTGFLFIWRCLAAPVCSTAFFISCLYTIRILGYYYFFFSFCFDVFFKFLCSFFFLYTVLLPCSVGCRFGCIPFLDPMVEELIPQPNQDEKLVMQVFLLFYKFLDFLLSFCEKTSKWVTSSINILVMQPGLTHFRCMLPSFLLCT